MKVGKKEQVIMRLIDAVSDNDIDRIQSFFADDSVYKDPQGNKIIGRQAISDVFASMHVDAQKVEWLVDRIQEDEHGEVQTEGQLRYLICDQWREVNIKGAFQVRGSKVAQWH
ncbi:MAG: limonene-1,2-epoxide hydrolase [Oceanicoccus sp.]|jgi:limonene-1,2-epoxide hydrolase